MTWYRLGESPKQHAFMYVILFNSQNTHKDNSLFIAKETERYFEIMPFMKLMSLVNGKLDLNSGLLTPPNKLATPFGAGLYKHCWSSASLSSVK